MKEKFQHIVEVEEAPLAVLVGVQSQKQTEEQTKEYLEELAFLAETSGLNPIKFFTQKLERPNSKTFVGSGKMEEILAYMEEKEIEHIIFDDELTPSQLKNIERELDRQVLDRTHLILDIFAQRARTSYACTQVELAQYEFLLPRLTRMWTHLERQKGGIGLRGPGETQIETDRRIMRDKISQLKEKLKHIDKQMSVQRGNRESMVRVALVGYTNVGKSTLMNLLSKSKVFAENKLFATLDTTVRKVVIDNLPFLLSDTVGFIRKLPTQLVESFKSTLDEVREADLLLHIVDISHPNFEEHYEVVNRTLSEIGAGEKDIMVVFNKIDNYTNPEADDLSEEKLTYRDLKSTWMDKLTPEGCIFISATEKDNVDGFKEKLYNRVKDIHLKRYPYNNFLY